MKNKLLLLVLVLVLLVPTVHSYIRVAPLNQEYFMLGEDIVLRTIVFNDSSFINSDDADCFLQVFGLNGSLLINASMNYSEPNFYVDLNSSVTSSLGIIPYVIWCNTSSEVDYSSEVFVVQNRIFAFDYWYNNILAIVLVFIASIVFFGMIGYFCLKFSGVNEDKTTFWFSIFCFGIAIAEFIFMAGIIFINELGWNLTELLRIHFYIMLLLSFGVGFAGLILLTIRIFKSNSDDKKAGKW